MDNCDNLAKEFFVRVLQRLRDHKDDHTAIKLTEDEFWQKINHDESSHDVYYFNDKSALIRYGNNKWEAYDN